MPHRARPDVFRRISLLVSISRDQDRLSGVLTIADVETSQQLPIEPNLFTLTLEHEPGATYARGALRVLPAGTAYPIQGNAAAFDALRDYVAGNRTES